MSIERLDDVGALSEDGQTFLLGWLAQEVSDRQWADALRAAQTFDATAVRS